jgi:hypothetical protein
MGGETFFDSYLGARPWKSGEDAGVESGLFVGGGGGNPRFMGV